MKRVWPVKKGQLDAYCYFATRKTKRRQMPQ